MTNKTTNTDVRPGAVIRLIVNIILPAALLAGSALTFLPILTMAWQALR